MTSEVTLLSDTLLMLTFSYSPLLLQSSVWFLINVSPHGSLCFPCNTSSMCKLYVYCFPLANTVRNHCLHFLCCHKLGALFFFNCMRIQQVLFVYSLSHVYLCREFLWKPERPHVHYYWPRSIKTKLLSESSLVMASNVYLRSHLWKWEC